jgi:class 3 adenylate cyclase
MRLGSAVASAILAIALAPPALPAGFSPETGNYIYQHYGSDQYNASPQNWDIIQDPRGVMYFGNTDGVLEFDGVSWRMIRTAGSSGTVRALALDGDGRVLVGGAHLFGRLEPDASGSMRIVSFVDRVPEADRGFSDVWRILPTREGIYFSAYERLFRLDPSGTLRVWRPDTNFGRAFLMQGKLYVKTPEQGLLTMQSDKLVPVPGGEIFKKLGITAGDSRGDGGLIATPGGFFELGSGGIKPFPTAADSFFAEQLLYTFHILLGGEIAAGTRKGGLVLLSAQGSVDRIINKSNGLADDFITAVAGDRQGGVWLAGNNGITRVNPGVSRFDQSMGLEGDVNCTTRQGGILYAGTSSGLFRMDAKAGQPPRFVRIAGIQTAVLNLLARSDGMVASTSAGVFVVNGDKANEIAHAKNPQPVWRISSSSRDPNTIYAAGRAGVFVLHRNGADWAQTADFAVPGQEFRDVLEDPDGRVWAVTREAVYRVDLRLKPPKQERFADAEGAPTGWKNARLFQRQVIFSTLKGLRIFSESTRRFEPWSALGSQFSDGSQDVFSLLDDPAGNVWLTGEQYHGVLLKQSSGYKWLSSPLVSAGIKEMWDLSIDPDDVAWAVGAKHELYRWERSLFGEPDRDFHVLTRRIGTLDNRQLLYGGAGALGSVRLPFNRNALRFNVAAPFNEDPASVEYQVMLEGTDREWSPWNGNTQKEYTYLPEGSYRFRVRARTPHGAVAEDSSASFGVLPPWYRTLWAYGIYLVLAGFGVWGIVRWRTHQLVEEKRQLENIVAERTVEIREQRDEIHRQERKGNSLLLNILPEAVAEELKSTGSVKPVGFDDVTVCFTDFVGFTLSSEKMAPAKLVDALNQYFTAFDEIIARYGLEKLKTIGDSYMFVSGLPLRRSAHAVDAVLAALEMVEVVKRLAPVTGWNIRVGLHSGPVVAGVVGIRKFAFDIWGNTVNFAARMESSGVPGRVNLSETACAMTRGLLDCEARGAVRTKEGREVPMFLAAGPARGLMEGEWTDGIPAAFAARYETEFGEKPPSFYAPPEAGPARLSQQMAPQ